MTPSSENRCSKLEKKSVTLPPEIDVESVGITAVFSTDGRIRGPKVHRRVDLSTIRSHAGFLGIANHRRDPRGL